MIQKQKLAVNLEKNSFLAGTLFKEKLYGNAHPYGRSLSIEAIEHQQRSALTAFYNENIRNNFEIMVSGGPSDATIDAIDSFFSNSGHFKPRTFEGDVETCPKTNEHVDNGREYQASIRMGKPTISRHHPDYTNAYVLNEILGGYFGSRLMQNIREEKGYTYGIHSSIINMKKGAHFAIGTDVKKQYLKETIDEIRKEIHKLQREPVGSDEFNTVISYIKGAYLASITTPFSIAEKIKTICFYDLDHQYYDLLFDRLATITPESLLLTAQKYFDPDSMTEVVVG
jgi:predicted Zn-dependent peptidase